MLDALTQKERSHDRRNEAPRPAADRDVSSLFRRGLGWKLLSQIVLQGTRVGVGIVLARLLTPHDFGLAAMALVLAGFVIPFSDMGLGAALIQRKNLSEDDRSTAFWTSVAAGLTFTVLGVVAAPYIADFYGDHAVGPLVAVLSIGFAVTALGSTQRSLLQRDMDFRNLELRNIAGILAGGATAIVLASLGYGPWAFVGQVLGVLVVSTVLVWFMYPWRPKLRFSRASFRDLGGFGVRALGGAFFTNLNQNTDNVLIGRFIGAAPLGLYAFAYNLMIAPLTRLVGPVQQVAFPAFSRLQDDRPRFATFWSKANRVIAATCAPLLVGVIVVAPDLVPLVFGTRWERAVPILQILCWVGILQCIQAMNDVVLQAGGAVKIYLRFTAASFGVNVIAFVLGLHWGVVGVASAFAISSTLIFAAYTVVTARIMKLDLSRLVRGLAGIVPPLAGMAICGLLIRELLERQGASPTIRLCATVAGAAAAYGLLLVWWAPDIIEEVRTLLQGRRRRAAEHPDAAPRHVDVSGSTALETRPRGSVPT